MLSRHDIIAKIQTARLPRFTTKDTMDTKGRTYRVFSFVSFVPFVVNSGA